MNSQLRALLIAVILLPVPPAAAQNVVDQRCAGGVTCQIWGCNRQARDMGQKEFSNPPHCRSGRAGFADAEEECQRIGGRPRPGPGGAPYIWCDAVQSSDPNQGAPVPAGTNAEPDFSRATSSADRVQSILDFGSLLLDLYSRTLDQMETPEQMSERIASRARKDMQDTANANRQGLGDLAKDFNRIAQRTSEEAMGDLSTAEAKCGTRPKTRRDLAKCFQALSNDAIRAAAKCESDATRLETIGRPAAGNVPRLHDPTNRAATGQGGVALACADLQINAARAANCVAVGILNQANQFNPLFKACAQRWNFN